MRWRVAKIKQFLDGRDKIDRRGQLGGEEEKEVERIGRRVP